MVHTLRIERAASCYLLLIRLQGEAHHLFKLLLIQAVCTVIHHVVNKVIRYRINNKYLLLSNTENVVIEGGSLDNFFGRVLDICRLINKDWRIACSRTDRLLA
ncbi:hypothetical protein D3C77_534910 [compost metagenome]